MTIIDQAAISDHNLRQLGEFRTKVADELRRQVEHSDNPPLAVAQTLQLAIDQATRSTQRHWDCRKGCAMCCYHPVTVTDPEALYIARVLRDSVDGERLAAMIQGLRDHVLKTAEIPDRIMWMKTRTACPFLQGDNTCGIYAARPVNCRAHNSLKKADCVESEKDPHFSVRTDMAALYAASLVMAESREAFGRGANREFISAVLCALEMPDADVRWMAGEDVFAGCVPAVKDGQ